MNHHADPSNSPKLKLLAISFAYPPLAYPRSIQVARLLKFLDASTVLVCGDEAAARKDATLEPDAEARLEACLRVPFALTAHRKLIDRIAYRFARSFWDRRNMAPDRYGTWNAAVLNEVARFMRTADLPPDVLVTFAQPFTDHLIGLELKCRYGLPWLAHFSDPWVDNPFNRYDEHTKSLNLSLEREVIGSADLLVFTSQETIDLVLGKYPDEYRQKARVVPQSFDPSLFPDRPPARNTKITIRYIGNFYGQRTAAPLIAVLSILINDEPDVLDDVCFELIGVSDPAVIRDVGGDALPSGLLNVYPSVEYCESLRLMSEADGLLIIDAPAELSVFLPSKLVDYIGSGRPVLGLTPAGTAAELIRQLGGPVADPSDVREMTNAMVHFIKLLEQRRTDAETEAWGTTEVRKLFEAPHVAASFEAMLRELPKRNQ